MSRLSQYHEERTKISTRLIKPIQLEETKYQNKMEHSCETMPYSQEGFLDRIKDFISNKVKNAKDESFMNTLQTAKSVGDMVYSLSTQIHIDKKPLAHIVEISGAAHLNLTLDNDFNAVVDPNKVIQNLELLAKYLKSPKFVCPKRYYGILLKDKIEKIIRKNGITVEGLLKSYDEIRGLPDMKFDTFVKKYIAYTGIPFNKGESKHGLYMSHLNLAIGHVGLYGELIDRRGFVQIYGSYFNIIFPNADGHKKPFHAKSLSGHEIKNLLNHTADTLKVVDIQISEVIKDMNKHATVYANEVTEEVCTFALKHWHELGASASKIEQLMEFCYPFYASGFGSYNAYINGLLLHTTDVCKAAYIYCRDANKELKDIQ